MATARKSLAEVSYARAKHTGGDLRTLIRGFPA